jgi:dynein heavy chain
VIDIFNLRDLSNVFQGILGAETSYLDSNVHVARLWVHECLRVFSDRLIDDTDKQWVLAQMTDMILPTTFQLKWHTVLAQQIPNRTTVTKGGDGGEDAADAAAPPLMFGSFTNPQAFTAMEQKYEDLGGLGHRPLMALVQSYLTDYNLSRADGGMNLVLFMYCVEHVVRVCRVLRQPGGNALLVGVGVRAYTAYTFLILF